MDEQLNGELQREIRKFQKAMFLKIPKDMKTTRRPCGFRRTRVYLLPLGHPSPAPGNSTK